jgi:hypothetical protein
MPNLVEVAMDHDYEGIHHVFTDRGLRSLSLVGYRRGRGLDPALLSELLINLPELVSLRLVRVQNLPSKLGETLASMPQLKVLELDTVECMDKSWAIPYASGGLSKLRLVWCPYVAVADFDTILAVHADTLEQLELELGHGRCIEWDQGPKYQLNRLETLRMGVIGYKGLQRFSRCPIKTLEVSTPHSLAGYPKRAK